MEDITIPKGFDAKIEGDKVVFIKKESEDEMYRKWILEYLYDGLRKTDEQFKDQFKSAIDWLEGQKERKSALCKSEIDFADIYSKGVWEKLALQFKTIEGFWIGANDVSDIVLNAILDAFKWAKSRRNAAEESKPDYSGLSEFERAIHRGFLCAGVENVPVGIIKDTAKECLGELNSSRWSKEDEKMLKKCISNAYDIVPIPAQRGGILYEDLKKKADKELVAWLKSLPERYKLRLHWTPSEKQMRELYFLAEGKVYSHEVLASLYNDLKKL